MSRTLRINSGTCSGFLSTQDLRLLSHELKQRVTQPANLDVLIRLVVNTIVHEIVVKHTNRPESEHFLEAEIIEYRSQAENIAKSHNWNSNDKRYVEDNAQIKIKEKLKTKYSDVLFKDEEI